MNKLVILLPTGGKVHTRFMTSLIGLTQRLLKSGIPFAVKNYEFSDLVMSRNYLVSYFLSQEDFTHALLLDSDLEFKPSQFFRLYEFDKDFTAAPYPDRRVTAGVLGSAVNDPDASNVTGTEDVRRLLAKHMRYIVTESLGSDRDIEKKRDGDFKTVASVGTGFMLIKRNVVEQIVASGQARPLMRTGKLAMYKDAPRFADFFSHHMTAEKAAFYGEDQSFCRRWILGCGGDVWVDCKASVSHIGEFTYFGDYSHKGAAEG